MENENSLLSACNKLLEAVYIASRNPQTVEKLKILIYGVAKGSHNILNKTQDKPFGKVYNYNLTPSYTVSMLANK